MLLNKKYHKFYSTPPWSIAQPCINVRNAASTFKMKEATGKASSGSRRICSWKSHASTCAMGDRGSLVHPDEVSP